VLALGGQSDARENVHPLPWGKLSYDPGRQGYIVDVSRQDLENAPFVPMGMADQPHTQAEHERLYGYYGVEWAEGS
jgi:hypothetical protein